MRPIALLAILAALIAAAPREPEQRMQPGWWDRAAEAQVGKYFVKTDLPPDQANALSRHLNVMYGEYSRRLAELPPRAAEHLNVYIFKSQQDYLDTLRTRFGVNATGSGGMFFRTPNGSGLGFFTGGLPTSRVEHVMQHEGFHQFAHSRFGDDLPMWVNEGLAEFFGESVLINGTLILGQSNPRVIDAVKDAIEKDQFIPFQKMLAMSPQGWNENVRGGSAALQYHQAWSMVHFLVYAGASGAGKGRGVYADAFETYLKLLNRGYPSEDAFIRAFRTDQFDEFQQRWKEYALAARPSAFIAALERLEFLSQGAMELSRRAIAPENLEALKAALREIKFEMTIARHGMSATLSAADDAVFEIPQDDLAAAQPVFEVTPVNSAKFTRKRQEFEKQQPTPPTIRTRGLKPRELEAAWARDPKSGEISGNMRVK